MKIDEKDIQILDLLEDNAGLSMKQISKITLMPITTVYNRIKKMEDNKIILNKTIRINYEKIGYDLKVVVKVRISKGKLFEVEKKVAKFPEVFAVYDITGDFDAVILARFQTRKKLDDFLKKLQSYDFVERTYTNFVLNTMKE